MANYPHDDPDEDYEESCDHDDYESDILTGIATCWRCGHRWMQTNEEIAAEHERIARYQEWSEKEERRETWRQVRSWFRSLIPRRRKTTALDDEIPF